MSNPQAYAFASYVDRPGGCPYVLNGFTYNLQDLTTLPFGAPTSTTVNGSFTFQGESLSVSQNGSWRFGPYSLTGPLHKRRAFFLSKLVNRVHGLP